MEKNALNKIRTKDRLEDVFIFFFCQQIVLHVDNTIRILRIRLSIHALIFLNVCSIIILSYRDA